MNRFTIFLITIISSVAWLRAEVIDQHADVIVYGSTPAGFCAAIAAAREGADVVLLEPSAHIGGMMTGGLSFSESKQMRRESLLGLFDEWHKRVVSDYTKRGLPSPYNAWLKNQSGWSYEPHVAQRVTRQMLREAGVELLTEQSLEKLKMEGSHIATLFTSKGRFTADVYVDASYEGDLMAAAGVQWEIGREGRGRYSEALAGKQYSKKKIDVDGFDAEGALLPLLTADSAGEDKSGDGNIMPYAFVLCLTDDPHNRVEIPKPAKYRAERFELIRRYLRAGGRDLGMGLRPLPRGKWEGRHATSMQFSLGFVGGSQGWHAASSFERQKIWEEHKQYTLEFYHFLSTDPELPESLRSRYAALGLCKDEYQAHGHFPPTLHVRESRRMVGEYRMSQQDIMVEPHKIDAIMVASSPIHLHDCQRIALKGGGVINEGAVFPVMAPKSAVGYAYHVPYRAILPKHEHCQNLLVPVALSASHVAYGSLRTEPTRMMLGQAAGVAASLASKHKIDVQRVHYTSLRERLVAQGMELELPAVKGSVGPQTQKGMVLDNSVAILSGTWQRSTVFKPFIGRDYLFSNKHDYKQRGESLATFRLKVPQQGTYALLMAYSPHASRATRVPVTLVQGAREHRFFVDQTLPMPDGKVFRKIAEVALESNELIDVTVSNKDLDGYVIVDAFQFIQVK
ncbi:FAD-dependent oxidoreductase [Rubritalea marina]|uniref:FAD-dependent oxidoreductase n=1 Tax=Rubritalea marina TaxID=361055 RepID=UPI00036A9B38|nr:FAD-dependent oxidoreductase [Rubritalea marina]